MPKTNNKPKQEKEKQKPASAPILQPTADETRNTARLQTLRGMRDILPEEMPYWQAVLHAVERTAQEYRYDRLITPLLEPTQLFAHGVGEATDIVEKEMYTFKDRSDESVTLRPEFTASMVRAYIEHGMHNRPQPVRMWDCGPAFRYDRPQAGRYRQFWQADFEIIGETHPVVDAQVIAAARVLYARLGIPVTVLVNSIGDKACRANYLRALTEHLREHASSLCEDCQRRVEQNPLRALDCKQAGCQAALAEAPQIVDWLCDGCRDHFIKVLEYLDELEVPYQLEPRLVRGLDYYTRTTFEVVLRAEEVPPITDEGASSAAISLGGGGRYDGLVEALGGRPTPAVGFAAGIERIILAMQRVGAAPETILPPQVFLAQLGNEARRKCLRLFGDLRARGFAAAEHFSKDGLSGQLEVAAKLGCHYTLILGQKELMDDTIIIRDMESGIQEIVEFKKAIPELEKRVARAESGHPMRTRSGGASGQGIAPAVSVAAGGMVVGAVFQETHRIDLKREEYLLRETVVETEEGMAADPAEANSPVSGEGVHEEEWKEKEDEANEAPEKNESGGGLSWVGKDYADDRFDE